MNKKSIFLPCQTFCFCKIKLTYFFFFTINYTKTNLSPGNSTLGPVSSHVIMTKHAMWLLFMLHKWALVVILAIINTKGKFNYCQI